jgi:cell division protein FtsB
MTEAVRLGYESGKLESALRQLREEVKKLEAEKASWLSLQKVEQIAREKLGLSEPGEGQIIYDDGPDIY